MANDNFQPGMPRTPTYAPGQSAAMMQDPLGLAIAMFGIPMMQGMAGPNKFLPQLTPGQALGDQIMARMHQRASIDSTMEATQAGNKEVNKRVLGAMSMLTGQDASQLNNEQTQQLTAMANHPITKMVLGQLVGTDNLESILFGRKGDPAALAATVNRVGFYRRDSLGGERMTAESMAGFSKALHANMYGEGADVDAMHGLMAGQAGQMYEHMFQRGMLPQSIGSLTAAERVKAVSSTKRDDATLDRLSDEYSRRDLNQSDRKFKLTADGPERRFAELTAEQQEDVLKLERPTNRRKLENTFRTIDAFQAEDPRSKSAVQIEKEAGDIEQQMAGYGVLARNADASKTADKIKQFSGAVSAVREIFGDNGNPNAPMPALLAALEHLSQGSMQQVGGKKVENTIRSMRLAARDAGIGFEQLAGMSAEVGAYGDTLGIARPISMQNTLNAAVMSKVMRDSGQFSQEKPLFGRMDQATATREAAMRMTRGDASAVGMTLAAMSRAVESNPEQFKNSPVMQELNKAYKEGRETFEVDGKKYNLAEIAGKGGSQKLAELFSQEGGNINTLRMFAMDPGTQQYLQAGYAFKTQRFQAQRDVNNEVIKPELMGRLASDEAKAALTTAGIDSSKSYAFASEFGARLTARIMEKTGDMTPEERVKYLQENVQTDLAGMLTGPNANERAAAMLPTLIGATEAERVDTLSRMAAGANIHMVRKTGQHLTGNAQLYNDTVMTEFARTRSLYANRAERLEHMSRGNESSLTQRISEEVAAVGEGGKFDRAKFLERTAGLLEIAGMQKAFAPELAEGLTAATEALVAGEEHAAKTGDDKEARRAADLIHTLQNADRESLVSASASALADKKVESGKLGEDAAKTLRAQYQKAALGDKAALEALQSSMPAADYAQLSGLHKAHKLAQQGIVLSREGLVQNINTAADIQSKREMEQRADAAAAAAQGPQPTPAAGKPPGASAAAAATTSAAAPQAPGATTTAASTVQLTADSVTVTAREAQKTGATLTLAAENIGPGAGKTANKTVNTAGVAAKPEMVVHGTLTLRNFQEAVFSAIGEQPMPTPSGVSIMNPHAMAGAT